MYVLYILMIVNCNYICKYVLSSRILHLWLIVLNGMYQIYHEDDHLMVEKLWVDV